MPRPLCFAEVADGQTKAQGNKAVRLFSLHPSKYELSQCRNTAIPTSEFSEEFGQARLDEGHICTRSVSPYIRAACVGF
jgi:hypothetical protein